VGLDGTHRDRKPIGDFSIREAGDRKFRNPSLAHTQLEGPERRSHVKPLCRPVDGKRLA
jgi:hypothetical protein